MIKYTNEDKTLTVPSGLGNFATNGGGGGSDVTRQDVIDIVESAITDYDTEIQVDLEDIRENVSGNSEDIVALSALTSANTADIAAISGAMGTVQVKAYYLDRMSKTERADLFNELWVNNGESNFEPSKYKFYELEDNDEYKGWAEVRLARFDSGRKIYFSVIFQSRNSSNVYQRGISISQDGTYKKNEFSAVVPLVDVTPLSAITSVNTQDIVDLSGVTENIQSNVNALSGSVENIQSNVESISAQTTANTADIETLSGVVETNESAISNLENYTQNELAPAIGGIGQDLEALSGQVNTLSSSTVNGLETAQNTANSARTEASSAYTLADSAYTLASSAYTLADSLTGQTGGGPDVYILNLMTQQERLALYNELAAYRDVPTYTGVQSGFPAQDYAFYYWAGEDNSDEFNDRFRGFVPMQLAAIHPDDYGGACFFTGVVYGRQGGGTVVMVRYIIASDGTFDMSRGMNEYNPHPEISILKIDSGGTFSEDLWNLGNLSNTDITYRLWLRVDDGTNFAQSPMQEYRKAYEEISADNWRDVYYFSALIPIGSTTYKGQWRIVQTDDWEGDGPYPATSWVAQ